MHWKIPWEQKNHKGAGDRSGSLYSLLRDEISQIRTQGDSPARDGESFSKFICDLCHRAGPISSLRQCVLCGRWACPECWKDEYYACSSCNGIIRLHQLPIREQKFPDAKDMNPHPDEGNQDIE